MWESGNDPTMPSEDSSSTHQQDASMRFVPVPRPAKASRQRPADRRSRKPEMPSRGRKPPVSPAPNGQKVGSRAPRPPLKFDEKLGSSDRLKELRDRRRKGVGSPSENRRLKPVPKPVAASPQRRSRTPRKVSSLSAGMVSAPPRPRTRSGTALVYGTRLLILGVGLGPRSLLCSRSLSVRQD